MSNADRTQLSYVQEVTFATTPSSDLKILRFTGESLVQETSSKDSDEIRADRQVAEVVRTGYRAMGDVTIELSYGNYDDWIAGALCSAGWSTPVSVNGTNISCSASDNSINSASNAFGSLNANQWVKLTGFTGNDAVNNGVMKILSKPTSGKVIITGKTLIDSSAGASVTVAMGAQVVNGVAEISFSIERYMTDLTTTRQAYRGMTIASMKLTAITDQIVTGSFSFMGQKETNETTTIGNGTYTAAANNPIMSGVDNILSVIYDATGTFGEVGTTEFSFTANNNLRPRTQLGDGGPISFGEGNFKVEGTFKGYFTGNTPYTKYLNFQDVGFAEIVQDSLGNVYVFDFPATKLTAAKRNASGQNTDIMQDMSWSAKRSAAEGVTARVVRFP